MDVLAIVNFVNSGQNGICEPESCVIRDCKGSPIPNPPCHLDTNKDGYIDSKDVQLVKDLLNTPGSDRIKNTKNEHLDTSDDGLITPMDALTIINFINGDQNAGTKTDECGVCGGPGKDSCGFCPGDPNARQDLGCGCGYPAPGPCGCDASVQDLGCGCGLPGPSGCDNQCGSSKTDCDNNICESKFGIKVIEDASWNLSDKFINDIRGLAPSKDATCLNSRIDRAMAICDSLGISRNSNTPIPGLSTQTNWFDDCVAHYFMPKDGVLGNLTDKAPEYFDLRDSSVHTKCDRPKCGCMLDNLGSTYKMFTEAQRTPVNGQCPGPFDYRGIKFNSLPLESYIFFDNSCNPVSPPDEVEQCIAGSLYYNPSPISLILDSKVDLSEASIVKFPLDNGQCPNCFFEWKTSEGAPLLVVDKDRTGKITDASQLFGNWTFGGKKLGSLDSSIRTGGAWANGYEALGSLDTNSDGKVSSEELSGLRLWFDKDRDGVSSADEVKDLTDFGITELYYLQPEQNANSKDLYLESGFAREVNGSKITGKSIDWYGIGAFSVAELLGKKQFLPEKNADIKNPAENIVDDSSEKKKVQSDIHGMWNWKTADGALTGILSFIADKESDSFRGYSFSETPLAKDSGYNSAVGVRTLEGKAGGEADKIIYSFAVNVSKGKVTSEFTFEKDGSLKGLTKVSGPDQTGSIEYSWVATRKVK